MTTRKTPERGNGITIGSLLSSHKLVPFGGGWVFRDFIGDFVNLYELVGLLVSLYGFAYPYCSAWIGTPFPTIAPIFRLGVF